MSDNIKLVIEISKTPKNDHERWILSHGKPLSEELNEIKGEILDYNIIQRVSGSEKFLLGFCAGMDKSAEIIDKHIGKAESEDKE